MTLNTPYHRGVTGRVIHTPFRQHVRKITPGRAATKFALYSSTPSKKLRNALALKEQQCEELNKKLSICAAAKQKLKGKLLEVVERHGELKRHLQDKIDEHDASARLCEQLQAELERVTQEANKRRAEAEAEIDALLESVHVKDNAIAVLQHDLHTVRTCLAGREQGQLCSANLACEVRELQHRVGEYAKQLQSAEQQLQERDEALAASKSEREDLLQKYKALFASVVAVRTTLDGAILQSGSAIAAGETKRAVRGLANSIMSLRHSLPSLSVSGALPSADTTSDTASSATCHERRDRGQAGDGHLEGQRSQAAASDCRSSFSSRRSSHSRFSLFRRSDAAGASTASSKAPASRVGSREVKGKDIRREAHGPSLDVLESQVFMPLGGGAMLARHSSLR